MKELFSAKGPEANYKKHFPYYSHSKTVLNGTVRTLTARLRGTPKYRRVLTDAGLQPSRGAVESMIIGREHQGIEVKGWPLKDSQLATGGERSSRSP